jgi:hypothetical protein
MAAAAAAAETEAVATVAKCAACNAGLSSAGTQNAASVQNCARQLVHTQLHKLHLSKCCCATGTSNSMAPQALHLPLSLTAAQHTWPGFGT